MPRYFCTIMRSDGKGPYFENITINEYPLNWIQNNPETVLITFHQVDEALYAEQVPKVESITNQLIANIAKTKAKNLNYFRHINIIGE